MASSRLVPTLTGWICPACGYKSSVSQESAQLVHHLLYPHCSEHLESDDAISPPPIRLDELAPNSLMQPSGAQYSQSVADFWSAPRGYHDMMSTAALQRRDADWQHPKSLLQPPSRPEDEGSAADFNSGQQMDSDDVVYSRDVPRQRERGEALDQQPIRSRAEQAIRVIKELQCVVCGEKWRNVATTKCRHLGCCKSCIPQTNGKCVVCRCKVDTIFPVEFHSSKLLKGLEVSFPLAETIGEDELQVFLNMGYPESKIRRAIRLIQLRNNSEALSDVNSVLDFMDFNPFPVPDELILLLDDPAVGDSDKSRICDYLEAISKCLMCRCKQPNICLLPCNHLAMCRECLQRQPRQMKCPDCEMPIRNQVMVFLP